MDEEGCDEIGRSITHDKVDTVLGTGETTIIDWSSTEDLARSDRMRRTVWGLQMYLGSFLVICRCPCESNEPLIARAGHSCKCCFPHV